MSWSKATRLPGISGSGGRAQRVLPLRGGIEGAHLAPPAMPEATAVLGPCRVLGVVHAGTAVDRMYKRPCPGGYTGERGAGVQYERRGADGATRATNK